MMPKTRQPTPEDEARYVEVLIAQIRDLAARVPAAKLAADRPGPAEPQVKTRQPTPEDEARYVGVIVAQVLDVAARVRAGILPADLPGLAELQRVAGQLAEAIAAPAQEPAESVAPAEGSTDAGDSTP